MITGATRNHGRASALAFAEEGANLLICTRRSMDLLEETAEMAAKSGAKVVTQQCDVTEEGQVETLVKRGMDEFGQIDVVVNNAGWRARGQLLDIGADVMSSATEMGLVGLTRGIAREYGKYNITANCIGPGGIENEEAEGLHPVSPSQRDAIPRRGTPEEVAFLAVTLCSEGASYITGQTLLANGGKHFL